MNKIISNLRLRIKIGGAFSLIILFLITGSLSSWLAVNKLKKGSDTYLEFTQDMMLSNRLQQNFQQTRIRVAQFYLKSDEKVLELYRNYSSSMKACVDEAQSAFTNGERPFIVDRVDALSQQYFASFDDLVTQENKRISVVNHLFTLGPVLLKHLTDAIQKLESAGEKDSAYELQNSALLLMDSRMKALRNVYETSAESTRGCEDALKVFIDDINRVSKMLKDNHFSTEMDSLLKDVDSYQAGLNEMLDIVSKKQMTYDKGLAVVGPQLTEEVEKLANSIDTDVAELGAELKKNAASALVMILIVSGVALAFAILVSVTLTRLILAPIKKVVGFSEKLANGDLTAVTAVTQKDEVGMMAMALEQMATALKEQFGEISIGVSSLASSANELSAISTQLSSNAHSSEEVSHAVATMSEQTSHNMSSVAASVEQMSSNIRTVATASEEMTSTINEISKNADKARLITMEAVKRVEKTNDLMRQLEKAADLIGTVTDTISGISSQTNLLALNATIEAASAGEAGKGFAVVANEIKELSRQTNHATGKISESISGIQNATRLSASETQGIVEIINEISSITNMIASAVEEQSASTSEIANNITQTSDGVQEITKNVDEVSKVTAETAKDVEKVNQSAKEIANASDQLNTSAIEIAEFSERLNMIVSKYKVC